MHTEVSPKLRLTTLLICLFFGGFGIHRMYVGKIGTGIAQLVLTCTGIGMIATVPWVLVDLIMIATGGFKDANGKMITKWQNE